MAEKHSRFTVNWNYPANIRFGVGRIEELPDACAALGIGRPLVVTDPGLEKTEIIPRVAALLRDAGMETAVFSGVKPNPTGANVEAGVAAYKAGGHDGVVAVGGGSALDAGKAVALMVGQTRPLWDFEDVADWYTRVDVAGMAPVVAVPTTSGTGSEVGRASVITDETAHRKKIIFHPRMLPGHVICDPALTVGLPPALTAFTGMDALSHNLEAFFSPFFHPMAEGIALEGIRLIRRALVTAYRVPTDLEARAAMMAASTMGATAFQKGLGAMHAVAHAAGALFDTQHGLTNAVVMPYVLQFNRGAILEKAARLARYLELADSSFDGLLAWILELREALDIPRTLEDIGVREDRLDDLTALAFADPSGATNPVPLTENNVRALIVAALRGA